MSDPKEIGLAIKEIKLDAEEAVNSEAIKQIEPFPIRTYQTIFGTSSPIFLVM
jgi:hypothetical protein